VEPAPVASITTVSSGPDARLPIQFAPTLQSPLTATFHEIVAGTTRSSSVSK
jgi:hypothetical protein